MNFKKTCVDFARSKINQPPSSDAPFPQADSVDRLIKIAELITKKPVSKNEIAAIFDFEERQASYYLNACKYLGLAEQRKVSKESIWSGSPTAKNIFASNKSSQIEYFCLLILSIDSCAKIFLALQDNKTIGKPEIQHIFNRSKDSLNCSGETTKRRAKTVEAWAKWVDSMVAD
jgi:hypothetical protein